MNKRPLGALVNGSVKMKVSYWYAQCLNDSQSYSIRCRTKKEALAARKGREKEFGPVIKVEVEYSDGFDLLTNCMGEHGGYWEC